MRYIWTVMTFIFWLGVISAAGYGAMMFLVEHGIKKHEIIECHKWSEQKETYPNWYATQWQVDQCRHYGVELADEYYGVNTRPGEGEPLIAPNKITHEGVASYYGYDLKRADQRCLDDTCWSLTHRTCATRDFPKYETLVVENKANGRQVECYINDFGPDEARHPDRIVDLSSYAFAQIADMKQGTVDVVVWIKE